MYHHLHSLFLINTSKFIPLQLLGTFVYNTYLIYQMKEKNIQKNNTLTFKNNTHAKSQIHNTSPTPDLQETRLSFKKDESLSKKASYLSNSSTTKNISLNTKQPLQTTQNTKQLISKLYKVSFSELLKSKNQKESSFTKKKRMEAKSLCQNKQDQTVKFSVIKSLANVIKVQNLPSNVNISFTLENSKCSTSRNDFNFIGIIGKGTFGNVWKVQHRKTLKLYAIKQMSKALIIVNKNVQNIMYERKVLLKFNHPFINKVYGSFFDRENIYLILQLLSGGDLRYHMTRMVRFREEQSRFMIACIVLGLQQIHKKNIIHRDIKPENIIFDQRGYLKLTDFGIARSDLTSDSSGTPGYMAPQVMCRLAHNFAVDYFAVGVIAYQMMTGRRPYNGKNRNQIRQEMLSKQVQVKKGVQQNRWSVDGLNFINKLIQRQPNNRLGFHSGIKQLKEHPWLQRMDWNRLLLGQLISPFIPNYDLHLEEEHSKHNEDLFKYQLLARFSDYEEIFSEYYLPLLEEYK